MIKRKLLIDVAVWLSLFASGFACAAVSDHSDELKFLVRANPSDPGMRCEPADGQNCLDDLDINQVFDLLNRMAADFGRSPFGGKNSSQSVQVNLGPGVFRPQRTLLISDWSSLGRFGALSVRGAGAGKTVIAGTIAVPPAAWEMPSSNESRISKTSFSNIRTLALSKLSRGFNQVFRRRSGFDQEISPLQMEVFVKDKPMMVARWPNSGWGQIEIPKKSVAAANSFGSQFSIRNGHLSNWKSEPNLFISGYLNYDWAFERLPTVVVNKPDGQLVMDSSGAKFGFRHGARATVENALSELDSPGEWYYEAATQTLYFWPPEPNSDAPIEVSWLQNLLSISKSNGVTFENLVFQGSTGDAVRIIQSRNVNLNDAVVRNAGNRAVVVEGGYAVALRRIEMTDLGEGGVLLAGGNRQTLMPANHVIEGCHFERFSRLSRSYRPAILIEGVGNQVLRNRITNGPHAAIIFGGNDHRIEGNHISDVVTETTDAGAIYAGRDWTMRGSIITNNLLQNIYQRIPGLPNVMGIYLDDQASGITVYGNLFANLGRAVLIGGGRDNVVDNNIFVSSSVGILIDSRGTDWQREQTLDSHGQLQRNFRNVPVKSDIYRTRYEHLENILSDEPGRAKYNSAKNNIFISTQDFEFLNDAQKGIERIGNKTVSWSAFKTMRVGKQVYKPQDFDMIERYMKLDKSIVYSSREQIPE